MSFVSFEIFVMGFRDGRDTSLNATSPKRLAREGGRATRYISKVRYDWSFQRPSSCNHSRPRTAESSRLKRNSVV